MVLVHRASPRLYDGPVAAAKAHIRSKALRCFTPKVTIALNVCVCVARRSGLRRDSRRQRPNTVRLGRQDVARVRKACPCIESGSLSGLSRRALLRARPSLWHGARLASALCPRRQVEGTSAVAGERPGRRRQRSAGGRLTRQPAAPPHQSPALRLRRCPWLSPSKRLALRGLVAPGLRPHPGP